MDRDRSENVIDPVERETPSTDQNDTGDTGSGAMHEVRKRRDRGTENASHDSRKKRLPK